MPGVLVDFASSSSSFPFEPGSALPCPALGNAAYEMSDDPYPPSPIPTFGLLCSSAHPLCQLPTHNENLHWACHPQCSLGLAPSGNLALQEAVVAGMGSSPELKGLPIPSPRKNFYGSSSPDSMVSSPMFSDTNGVGASTFSDAFAAFQKFLPSNNDEEVWPADAFPAMDVYSCDDFRMYEFKVRRCMRGRSHDWTECPFAHPGEKARRRDPRRFHYSGTACPDFRKGSCKRGEACEFAHGVFECWLHPARYRTQPCKDGRACRRRVCFFAHSTKQLRVLPSAMTAAAPLSSCLSSSSFSSSGGMNSPSSSKGPVTSYDGSPLRQLLAGATLSECSDSRHDQVPRIMQKMMESKSFGHNGVIASSPTSTLYGQHATSPPSLSPSLSPSTSPPLSPEPFTSWPRNVNSTPGHYPQSPLSNSSPAPAHRRHLNRLQSVPTISIPPAASDVTEVPPTSDDLLFGSPSITGQSPRNGISELLHSLQTLQLRSRVAELQRANSTPASPLSHKWSLAQQSSPGHCLYRSNPVVPLTPEGNVEVQVAERVESGRSLRAEIYGKIGRDNGIGGSNIRNEGPDLGWVNELVK